VKYPQNLMQVPYTLYYLLEEVLDMTLFKFVAGNEIVEILAGDVF
jgi:hypothetical protein